jgi:hypothetical protein
VDVRRGLAGPNLRAPSWVLAAALLLFTPAVARGDKAEEAAKAKARSRQDALQGVVDAWLETRKGLVDPCSSCGGRGVILRGRFTRTTCTSCNGKKLYIWPKRWQRLRYDLLTPAKRLTLKLADVEAEREKADPESPDTGYLKYARRQRVELVGDRFGRAYAFEGRDTVNRESRWVEVVDPASKRATWFLFSEDTDGPWEETVTPPPEAVPPATVPKVETLKPDETTAIRGKVALVDTKLSFAEGSRDGGTLVLVFAHPNASDASTLVRDFDASLVALATAAFEVAKDASAIRLVVLARWRDKFGEVHKRPFRTAEISREVFGRLRFDRLERAEALSHFGLASPTHEGEILWWKD